MNCHFPPIFTKSTKTRLKSLFRLQGCAIMTSASQPMSLSIGQFLMALYMLGSTLHISLAYIKAYVGWLHGFGSLYIM